MSDDYEEQIGLLESALQNRNELIEWQAKRIKELERRAEWMLSAAEGFHTENGFWRIRHQVTMDELDKVIAEESQ